MHLKRRRLNTLSSSLLEKQPKKSTSQNSQMKDVFIFKYSDETFLGYFFNTVTFTRVSNNPLQNVLLGNA